MSDNEDKGYLFKVYSSDKDGRLYNPYKRDVPVDLKVGDIYTDFPTEDELIKGNSSRFSVTPNALLNAPKYQPYKPHVGFSANGLADPAYSLVNLEAASDNFPEVIPDVPDWFKDRYNLNNDSTLKNYSTAAGIERMRHRDHAVFTPRLYSKIKGTVDTPSLKDGRMLNKYDYLRELLELYLSDAFFNSPDESSGKLVLVETPLKHVIQATNDMTTSPQRDSPNEIVTQSIKPVKVYDADYLYKLVRAGLSSEDVIKALADGGHIISDENYKTVISDLSNWWDDNSRQSSILKGLKAMDI